MKPQTKLFAIFSFLILFIGTHAIDVNNGCVFSLDSQTDPTLTIKCQNKQSYKEKLSNLISVDHDCNMKWNNNKQSKTVTKLQGIFYVEGSTLICAKGDSTQTSYFKAIDIKHKAAKSDLPYFYKFCKKYTINEKGLLIASCTTQNQLSEKTLDLRMCTPTQAPLENCVSPNGGHVKCENEDTLSILKTVTYENDVLKCPNLKLDLSQCEVSLSQQEQIVSKCGTTSVVDFARNYFERTTQGIIFKQSKSSFKSCTIHNFLLICPENGSFNAIDIREYLNVVHPGKYEKITQIKAETTKFYKYCTNYYIHEGNFFATCENKLNMVDLTSCLGINQNEIQWMANGNFPFSGELALTNGHDLEIATQGLPALDLLNNIVYTGHLLQCSINPRSNINLNPQNQNLNNIPNENKDDILPIEQCYFAYHTPTLYATCKGKDGQEKQSSLDLSSYLNFYEQNGLQWKILPLPGKKYSDTVEKCFLYKFTLICKMKLVNNYNSVDLRDGIINYNGIITFNTKSANYFYLSDLDLKRFKGSFYKTCYSYTLENGILKAMCFNRATKTYSSSEIDLSRCVNVQGEKYFWSSTSSSKQGLNCNFEGSRIYNCNNNGKIMNFSSEKTLDVLSNISNDNGKLVCPNDCEGKNDCQYTSYIEGCDGKEQGDCPNCKKDEPQQKKFVKCTNGSGKCDDEEEKRCIAGDMTILSYSHKNSILKTTCGEINLSKCINIKNGRMEWIGNTENDFEKYYDNCQYDIEKGKLICEKKGKYSTMYFTKSNFVFESGSLKCGPAPNPVPGDEGIVVKNCYDFSFDNKLAKFYAMCNGVQVEINILGCDFYYKSFTSYQRSAKCTFQYDKFIGCETKQEINIFEEIVYDPKANQLKCKEPHIECEQYKINPDGTISLTCKDVPSTPIDISKCLAPYQECKEMQLEYQNQPMSYLVCKNSHRKGYYRALRPNEVFSLFDGKVECKNYNEVQQKIVLNDYVHFYQVCRDFTYIPQSSSIVADCPQQIAIDISSYIKVTKLNKIQWLKFAIGKISSKKYADIILSYGNLQYPSHSTKDVEISQLEIINSIYYKNSALHIYSVPQCKPFTLNGSVLSLECVVGIESKAEVYTLDLNTCIGYDEVAHMKFAINGNFSSNYLSISLVGKRLVGINKATQHFDMINLFKGITFDNNGLTCKDKPVVKHDGDKIFVPSCNDITLNGNNELRAHCYNPEKKIYNFEAKLNLKKCLSLTPSTKHFEWKYTSYKELVAMKDNLLDQMKCQLVQGTMYVCNDNIQVDLSSNVVNINGELKCRIDNEIVPPVIIPENRIITKTCNNIIFNEQNGQYSISANCQKETEDDVFFPTSIDIKQCLMSFNENVNDKIFFTKKDNDYVVIYSQTKDLKFNSFRSFDLKQILFNYDGELICNSKYNRYVLSATLSGNDNELHTVCYGYSYSSVFGVFGASCLNDKQQLIRSELYLDQYIDGKGDEIFYRNKMVNLEARKYLYETSIVRGTHFAYKNTELDFLSKIYVHDGILKIRGFEDNDFTKSPIDLGEGNGNCEVQRMYMNQLYVKCSTEPKKEDKQEEEKDEEQIKKIVEIEQYLRKDFISIRLNDCLSYDKNGFVLKSGKEPLEFFDYCKLSEGILYCGSETQTVMVDIKDLYLYDRTTNKVTCNPKPKKERINCHDVRYLPETGVLQGKCVDDDSYIAETSVDLNLCIGINGSNLVYKYHGNFSIKTCLVRQGYELQCNEKKISLSNHVVTKNGELKCKIDNDLLPKDTPVPIQSCSAPTLVERLLHINCNNKPYEFDIFTCLAKYGTFDKCTFIKDDNTHVLVCQNSKENYFSSFELDKLILIQNRRIQCNPAFTRNQQYSSSSYVKIYNACEKYYYDKSTGQFRGTCFNGSNGNVDSFVRMEKVTEVVDGGILKYKEIKSIGVNTEYLQKMTSNGYEFLYEQKAIDIFSHITVYQGKLKVKIAKTDKTGLHYFIIGKMKCRLSSLVNKILVIKCKKDEEDDVGIVKETEYTIDISSCVDYDESVKGIIAKKISDKAKSAFASQFDNCEGYKDTIFCYNSKTPNEFSSFSIKTTFNIEQNKLVCSGEKPIYDIIPYHSCFNHQLISNTEYQASCIDPRDNLLYTSKLDLTQCNELKGVTTSQAKCTLVKGYNIVCGESKNAIDMYSLLGNIDGDIKCFSGNEWKPPFEKESITEQCKSFKLDGFAFSAECGSKTRINYSKQNVIKDIRECIKSKQMFTQCVYSDEYKSIICYNEQDKGYTAFNPQELFIYYSHRLICNMEVATFEVKEEHKFYQVCERYSYDPNTGLFKAFCYDKGNNKESVVESTLEMEKYIRVVRGALEIHNSIISSNSQELMQVKINKEGVAFEYHNSILPFMDLIYAVHGKLFVKSATTVLSKQIKIPSKSGFSGIKKLTYSYYTLKRLYASQLTLLVNNVERTIDLNNCVNYSPEKGLSWTNNENKPNNFIDYFEYCSLINEYTLTCMEKANGASSERTFDSLNLAQGLIIQNNELECQNNKNYFKNYLTLCQKVKYNQSNGFLFGLCQGNSLSLDLNQCIGYDSSTNTLTEKINGRYMLSAKECDVIDGSSLQCKDSSQLSLVKLIEYNNEQLKCKIGGQFYPSSYSSSITECNNLSIPQGQTILSGACLNKNIQVSTIESSLDINDCFAKSSIKQVKYQSCKFNSTSLTIIYSNNFVNPQHFDTLVCEYEEDGLNKLTIHHLDDIVYNQDGQIKCKKLPEEQSKLRTMDNFVETRCRDVFYDNSSKTLHGTCIVQDNDVDLNTLAKFKRYEINIGKNALMDLSRHFTTRGGPKWIINQEQSVYGNMNKQKKNDKSKKDETQLKLANGNFTFGKTVLPYLSTFLINPDGTLSMFSKMNDTSFAKINLSKIKIAPDFKIGASNLNLKDCLSFDKEKGLIQKTSLTEEETNFNDIYSSCTIVGNSLVCSRKNGALDTIAVEDVFESSSKQSLTNQRMEQGLVCRAEKREKTGNKNQILSNCGNIWLQGTQLSASCIIKENNDEHYVQSTLNLDSCIGVKRVDQLTETEKNKIPNKAYLQYPDSEMIVLGNGGGFTKLKNLNTKITKKLTLSTRYTLTGSIKESITVNYNLGDFVHIIKGKLTCRTPSTGKHRANLKKLFF